MKFTMTKDEREQFLAEPHVGIVCVSEAGRGPLAVPVWYIYQPGRDLWFLTSRNSKKAKLMQETDRISLCVQTYTPPYQYLTVEGPFSILDTVENEHHLEMACRYLGEDEGKVYVETEKNLADIRVSMHPEHWLSADYSKESA
ncbi:MAG: pyridoxamine 5'-phosphate oxidase family protein [SAR324 cluster bacterium]|nr:pyridoxamine 5'-phosphate oxidase family protein [SAR324 cluster bacterium]